MNGNSLSPHYATAQSHQATNVNSNAYQITNNWDAQAANAVQQTAEPLKSSSQHSAVANAAAGYFSRHTGNGLGSNQVISQRLSGINSGSSDNQLTNGSNIYANGPHSQPSYANPSLYYGSPSSQQQQQSFSPLSKSPSQGINRSSNRSALQQQLTSSNPQYASAATPTNSTTSPSLNLSHRSKSVDLNSNENSDNSSHSTSSQQNKMNNAQSPLNSLLNNSNNSNIKTSAHQPDAYFNSPASATQLQPGATINSYYGEHELLKTTTVKQVFTNPKNVSFSNF